MGSPTRHAVLASIVTLSAACGADAQTIALPSPEPHISADGTGEVKVPPDLAIVRLGVNVEGADARRAQARAAEDMAKITKAIQGKGVPAERITTDRLDLQPVWEHDPKSGRSRVVGYRATNVLRVEVALGTPPEGAKAGVVVDAAIAAGANELQGIEFTLRDYEPTRLNALEQASARARARAQELARALGVRLGRLLEASTGGAGGAPPVPYMTRNLAMKAEAAADTSVAPGELTVQVTVGVTYAIEQ